MERILLYCSVLISFMCDLKSYCLKLSALGLGVILSPPRLNASVYGIKNRPKRDSVLFGRDIKIIKLFFNYYLDPEAKTSLVLVFLSIPGHLLFFFAISKIKMIRDAKSYNPATSCAPFVTFYMFVSFLQVNIKLIRYI